MVYVYILQSDSNPDRYYVGLTDDPTLRLSEHNAGKSIHTSKFKPWRMTTVIGFSDGAKANAFETYLKSGSGRAFAKKHF